MFEDSRVSALVSVALRFPAPWPREQYLAQRQGWCELEVQDLFRVIVPELGALEDYLRETLDDANPGVKEVVTHLLQAGGKRVRPALVFLAAKFGKVQDPRTLLPVAAATELIHMATLAHDDILDSAPLRRGHPTVHTAWNRRVGILAGDYLFAQAFRLLAGTGEPKVTTIMASVVYEMCQGEIQQNVDALRREGNDEKAYFDRIGKKTALFLAESCRVGAVISKADDWAERLLYTFGWSLGLGFQVVDDVLDLTASSVAFGKAIGTDLRGGILTLPVIHALANSPDRERLEDIARAGAADDGAVEEVRGILGRSGSIAYAEATAKRLVDDAIDSLHRLPDCDAREALVSMASFVVQRQT